MHYIQYTGAIALFGISASLPAQTSLTLSTGAASSAASTSVVPIHEVAPANATSSRGFSNIFMVRETSGGRVIVNDGLRRQLVLLDANLANPAVVLDSVNEGGQAYGLYAQPTLQFLGDSSLHGDVPSRTLLVLDGTGKVVRAMAPPKQTDFGRLFSDKIGLDKDGNLYYRAFTQLIADTTTSRDGTFTRKSYNADSIGIVLAKFQTRSVDTIARLKQDGTTTALQTTLFGGKKLLHVWLNPLTTIDDWAVLSDGTVALVRGHDYHVDWLLPDGTKKSGSKLPFDWKKLSDEDKQHLLDSTRSIIEKVRADAEADGGLTAGNDAVVNYLRNAATPTTRPVQPLPANVPKPVEPAVTYDFAPLKDIADYYPPIRVGAAKADEDNNLWLLPTTSAQSKHGELVYDVVNPHNTNFYRVRMPVGRSIAGFGKNGIIYLMYKNGTEWRLERARIESSASAKD